MKDRPEQTSPTGALIRPFLDGGAGAGGQVNAHRSGNANRSGSRTGEPGPAPAPGTPNTSVRPFLVTAGRTASASDFPVETQVVVTSQGGTAAEALTFEYRDIVNLCVEPVAVAEIAARLRLHLGVIRVLVGDLQQQGIVTTYQPESDANDDVEMIMRVIHGLRQLS